MIRKKLWLDTDLNADVGDVGALACACTLHNAGIIELIGVTICMTSDFTPGMADQILRQFGLTDVPIGIWKGVLANDPSNPNPVWIQQTYADARWFRAIGLSANVPNAVDVFGEVMAQQPDDSVIICAIGPLNNIKTFKDSHLALVNSKVRKLYVMGGDYPNSSDIPGGAEFNFYVNSSAKAGATDVAANWPTTIVYGGYTDSGSIFVGGTLNTRGTNDIIQQCYVRYNAEFGFGLTRPGWDEMGVLQAAYDAASWSTVRGSNAVTLATGANVFTPSATGKDYYMVKRMTVAWYQTLINRLMDAPRTVPLTSWPAGTSIIQL